MAYRDLKQCAGCGTTLREGRCAGCGVPHGYLHYEDCPVRAERKREAFADRLPDFGEPPEEHRGVLLEDEIDYLAVAKVVTHAGRLHAAVRASVANLEASELAGVGTIAHVIRTLKDALNG